MWKLKHHPAQAAAYACVFDPGTALLVAGTVMAATGAVTTGMAASQAGKYSARASRQAAEHERQLAEVREQDFRREQSRLQARARALRAGSGVAYAGTPLLTDTDMLREIEHQAAIIRVGGEAQATRYEQEAQLARMRGRSAKTAGFIKAGSTLLTGFGEAYDKAFPVNKAPNDGTNTRT